MMMGYRPCKVHANANDLVNLGCHFLYVAGAMDNPKAIELSSPWYQESGPYCKLSVALHMNNMEDGNLKIVVETRNHTWVIVETLGNGLREWRTLTQSVGRISQPFRLKLEFTDGKKIPSHAAVDNIRLLSCLTEIPPNGHCDSAKRAFRCDDGRCLPRDQVCDISKDCPGGEDEDQDCDQVLEGSRCDFERGWCGWVNTLRDDLDWRRHNGSTPTPQTGPGHDNTYKNSTGMYVYVDMSETRQLGNAAVLQSTRFPPPPKYHSNPASPYFNSCQIRFFYHLYGPHIGDLVVRIVEEDPRYGRDNKSTDIWRESRNMGDMWHRAAVPLPPIKNWYTIQFIGKRGIRFRGDTAIDDISLSPECSGIGVPKNETAGWPPDPAHYDEPKFIRYVLTSCGAKGRVGPHQNQCTNAYQDSVTQVQVLSQGRLSGVQVWTAPVTGLYTIIAKGASGGLGPGGSGPTGSPGLAGYGARVRAVFPFTAGTQIYFLVGQEGIAAVRDKPKDNHNRNSTETGGGGSSNGDTRRGGALERVRGLHNASNGAHGSGNGGGGGGATFVFQMDSQGIPIPLMVAAGGGGIAAIGRFSPRPADLSLVHGKGFNSFLPRPGMSGQGNFKGAGGGGGWNGSAETEAVGFSLLEGGLGGFSCNSKAEWPTYGGFGGGGGGCTNGEGGGGGGYNGGNAVANSSGEGGYSFVSLLAIERLTDVEEGQNAGPGSLDVMPAIAEGCGCEQLCIVLDPSLEEKQCVCPIASAGEWPTEDNVTKCAGFNSETGLLGTPHLIGTVVAAILIFVIFSIICFCLYTRYQRQQLAALRRKAMAAPELQLSRLRGPSSSMVSEYNPNYEFGSGAPCSVQGLKEIPRENLRLVRALGQGAFGEVYQGYLRHVAGDTVEMPVAVKVLQTLPELSSNQTEMDFLMEAIIMSKFHHANIVHFIGICFDKHPRFIVLELLSGGDLKTFLRESRPKPERPSTLTMRDLLKCALDVAKGCRYLEENHFIHRDIAARNCLLTTKGPGRVVKIADFGMSRDIYRADYYRKGGKAMLPVKWMPPEAFLEGVFTSKTDVWSFGVLLWEVMSLGYMPYPGRGNQEVMQLVTGGGRLEAPPGCPGPVYRIMVHCWHTNPEERPSFVTVLERIGYCMQDPDVLAMPIPVFQRPLSQERDTTIVRPPAGADTSDCLRVLRPRTSSGNLLTGTTTTAGATGPSSSTNTSDYLIPLTNNRSSSADLVSDSTGSIDGARRPSGSDQCGYWETSFTREGVKAIARGEVVPDSNGSAGNLSLGDLRSGSTKRRSKGYATVPTFEAPTLSQSQSSQPLLDTPPDSPTATDDGPNSSSLNGRASNGDVLGPLDATTLCRQSYANVRIVNPAAATPSIGNSNSSTPSRATPPTKAERSVKQNEISC
ncbi:hypothetical protein OUZ56_028317 [Daphnia magna]|uniref:Tyrosine-protein kinase receptor n=1 Tax=Daphnia magna TaxID=35525 RepID=A0ABR0B3P2_9CRUS|nr:hypothetical protein OUZ56_028317 [Daphnia magna]